MGAAVGHIHKINPRAGSKLDERCSIEARHHQRAR